MSQTQTPASGPEINIYNPPGVHQPAPTCGPESIVRVTHYLAGPIDEANDKARSRLYLAFLGGCQPPPTTLVRPAALALPNLLYEVEAMAIVKR
ncbi:hypothetical protein ACLMJK_006029 [Lecanora helva]